MKLTSPAGRRLAVGVSLACAAVLLPAAALAASGGHAAQSRVTAARVVAAPCHAAATEVWNAAQSNGAAGTIYWEFEISNIGHSACTLFGYPGVSEINIHGHQVGLPATHSGTKLLVTLAPGGTSHFLLAVHDAGAFCVHPVTGSTLRVFPPGQKTSQLIEFPEAMCPHKSTMHVDAVHPGTGIPFFSRN
jgi:hypothetical protein